MKISIVTISFNQARYLRDCIDSVLSQDYKDIEYIIVDPGSTDGSREIVESYGSRILRVFEKDAGPADGLNKGFGRASGDILYFINSDDFVEPGCFSSIVDAFSRQPVADVIIAGGSLVNGQGDAIRSFYPSKVTAKGYVNGAVTMFQQGMFFRAELFKKVGGFNKLNSTCWDGELLLRFVMNNARVVRVMEKVAAFRIYPESITGSQRFAAQYELDQARLFAEVYGNRLAPKGWRRHFYRLGKILGDPLYVYKRCIG